MILRIFTAIFLQWGPISYGPVSLLATDRRNYVQRATVNETQYILFQRTIKLLDIGRQTDVKASRPGWLLDQNFQFLTSALPHWP